MPKISPDRLLSDLKRASEFGRYKTGVHRPTYSPQDMDARRWLVAELQKAGLDASIDGIGTVLGRSRREGRRLLIGSHLESQNYAGRLDGTLGVIFGLEVARAFADDPKSRHMPIDVGAWADEEGHFGSLIGSRSFCGELSDDEIAQLKNKHDGTKLTTALEAAGLQGIPRFRLVPAQYVGYLEAHIEQGGVLENKGLQIGIVTSIVGNWQYRVTVHGEQNHAGTTPMFLRKDAAATLVDLCHAIESEFPKFATPTTVWTVCRLTLDPGAPHIVPGQAEMLFQFRDSSQERLRSMEKRLLQLVDERNDRGPCRITIETMSRSTPSVMAPDFQAILEESAELHAPSRHMRMPSGAGHDAQIFARHLPACMLFVPSIGGISHDIREDTSDDDIVMGCQVVATAAFEILSLCDGAQATVRAI
ncbi:hydantoinase/carbamoylase family amidase [Pseudorhodoplanes sp.]|uniref:hydantoinase/carbamoylase family amidase n=1 Tax=Pseudorhodoplanes sp. TaxID=1934341 RepID=UPI003D0A6EBD